MATNMHSHTEQQGGAAMCHASLETEHHSGWGGAGPDIHGQ
jgi:hypothetical protein